MSIKEILFDLDGTLLPMDQDLFVKTYFGLLAKKLASYGYEPQTLINAVWAGTTAMIKNSGEVTNEEAFWKTFAAAYSDKVLEDLPLFDAFYRNEFAGVKEVCGYNPQAADTIATLQQKGFRLVLATNPLFPQIATENRIRWAGLTPESFELYTTYEISHYCKPNPKYYLEILQTLNVSPEECLMVGNDVTDDMIARELGMDVFLLTDCLINEKQGDISVYPNGSFPQLLEYINQYQ